MKIIDKIKNKLAKKFYQPAKNQDELIAYIKESYDNNLLDYNSLKIIEGTFQVENMQVRDVMIPRSKMIILELSEKRDELFKTIVNSAHSRFPVVGNNRDEVQGILFAKDVLSHFVNNKIQNFNCKEYLRDAIIIPESKKLGALLKEFQQKKSHMAIVMDEYGVIAGLITIENILEQIVGNIDDEHDIEEDNIIAYKKGRFLIKAHTTIEEFNETFKTNFEEDGFETIAGLIVHNLGYVPKQLEKIKILDFDFKVLKTDTRRLHLLEFVKKEKKDG